jgi:hypothetical protein
MMKKNTFITSVKNNKKIDDDTLHTFILTSDTPGYRMKSYGPTSLINFKTKKLIDTQIEAINKAFRKYEIILCCGFDVEKVCKYIRSQYHSINVRIVENQLYNNSNSCESVRLALNNTSNNKVFIIDGSLLFNCDLFKDKINESHVYIEQNKHCENLEVGININENNVIEFFSYGAINCWSEILYLHNKDSIETFRKIISSIDFKNKFIFEALNEFIKTRKELKYIQNKAPVTKVNNIKTYHEIKDKI